MTTLSRLTTLTGWWPEWSRWTALAGSVATAWLSVLGKDVAAVLSRLTTLGERWETLANPTGGATMASDLSSDDGLGWQTLRM
jgi:hypothetical protein